MNEADQSLMLEILKRLQADMSDVKRDLAGIRVELSAMGQQLAGLTTAQWAIAHALQLLEEGRISATAE